MVMKIPNFNKKIVMGNQIPKSSNGIEGRSAIRYITIIAKIRRYKPKLR